MKHSLLLLTAFASCAAAEPISDRMMSSFEVRDKVHWGSLSVHRPSAGFYGQYFSFDEPVILKSISVFVYDHPDYSETEASINFGVWAFNGRPTDEIYLSGPEIVQASEVGGWKTFEIPVYLELEAGQYVLGAGQRDVQRFVAFGNARAVSHAKHGHWLTKDYPSRVDGSSGWIQISHAPQSVECPTAADCALMIRVNVADAR